MAGVKKHILDTKYRKLVIMMEQGTSVKDMAEKLHMHPKHVYTMLKKPEFVEKKDKFEESVIEAARKRFAEHLMQAVEKIIKIAKRGKPTDRIQLDASKEVLYQVGLKPVEVIETRKREYTPEEIQSAAKVAHEVERIADRLSGTRGRFVLKQPEERLKDA